MAHPTCHSCGPHCRALWLAFCRITFSGQTNVFPLNLDFFWGKVSAPLGAIMGKGGEGWGGMYHLVSGTRRSFKRKEAGTADSTESSTRARGAGEVGVGPSFPWGLPFWGLPLFPRGVIESECQTGKLRPRGGRKSHCLLDVGALVTGSSPSRAMCHLAGVLHQLSSPEGEPLRPLLTGQGA